LGLGVQKKCVVESEHLHVRDSPALPQPATVDSQTPQDGEQMTQELMEWFEAVGNLEDQIMGMATGPAPDGGPYQQMPDRGFVFDYGEELSSVMKDFF
jgi:hypothetical protein